MRPWAGGATRDVSYNGLVVTGRLVRWSRLSWCASWRLLGVALDMTRVQHNENPARQPFCETPGSDGVR